MAKHYKIHINFLGKDSVPYDNTIEVPKEIWEQFQKVSQNPGELFPNATSGTVKDFLNQVQKGITPKNLRTVVCNEVLINELRKKNVQKTDSDAKKIRAIFEANLEIAKTLNHQKNVGKNQKEQEAKSAERVQKTKQRIKDLKAKHKERYAALKVKAEKYKVALKGQKLLKEKLAEIEEQSIKLNTQMERAIKFAEQAEFNLDKKKLTKDIALGTSLAAYADPQVLYSYLKSIDLPIEKIYTASARKSFEWAEGIDENYWRTYPS